MKFKDILIIVGAFVAVGIAVVFQTSSELGFGFDQDGLSNDPRSLLAAPLRKLAEAYKASPVSEFGQQVQARLQRSLDEDVAKNPFIAGNYAYALTVFITMGIASLAIILVGREEAEEKTILPVKK